MSELYDENQVHEWWNSLQIKEPTPAWDILDRVINMIEDDEKRFDMGSWGGIIMPAQGGPACGTVCCLAGWAGVMVVGMPVTAGRKMAYVLAGEEKGENLYSRIFINVEFTNYRRDRAAAHAIGALRYFMMDNRDLLQSRIVEPGGGIYSTDLALGRDR